VTHAKMRELMYLHSSEIERQVGCQALIECPYGDSTERADYRLWKEMSFVSAYYAFLSTQRRLPSQQEYVKCFFEGNQGSVARSPNDIRQSMRCRAQRNYRIFVCEHHLFSLCIESQYFQLAYKSEELDLEGTVDLVLRLRNCDMEVGIALKTRGRASEKWDILKERRREVRDKAHGLLWEGPIIPHHRDTRRMRNVNNLHLFREDETGTLAGLIRKEALFNES